MTSAEEIATAATTLRSSAFIGVRYSTSTVAALLRARAPLANWLDETATEVRAAEGTEYELHPNGGLFAGWEAALATARAINGGQQ